MWARPRPPDPLRACLRHEFGRLSLAHPFDHLKKQRQRATLPPESVSTGREVPLDPVGAAIGRPPTTTSTGSAIAVRFVAALTASLGSCCSASSSGAENRSLEVVERAQRRDPHVVNVARRVQHGSRQPIDRSGSTRSAEKDARRGRGGARDCRIRGVERVEHAVERARIGIFSARNAAARASQEAPESTSRSRRSTARADQRQPCDGRLARRPAVRAQIGDQRFDLTADDV